MYKYIKYPSSLMLILVALNISAQDRKPMIKVADEHYNRFEYRFAAPIYESLAKNGKAKTAILQKLANSYKQANDYEKAAGWYQIIVTKPDAQNADFLAYGNLLKNLGKYDEAKAAYQQYGQKSGKDMRDNIAACDSAVVWLRNPTLDKVKNVDAVNTAASDWGTAVDKQKNLIFASDSLRKSLFSRAERKNKPAQDYGWTDRPYQKLYQYNPDKGTITAYSEVLNGNKYHVGPVIFSNDENTAYFTITNPAKLEKNKNKALNFYGTRRLEIFSSQRQNGVWQQPVAFAYNNSAYSVGHVALSKDGNTLYFASDMPGGQGKTDIWYCEKQSDNSWGSPKNCGTAVNTTEEEEFPTIGDAGVLYFSSKGHAGMGGFDIFSTDGQKFTWIKPVNLKSPLNSAGDDFYLTMEDAESGYFSSNRTGGHGEDDIYSYAREKAAQVVVIPPVVAVVPPATPVKAGPKVGEKFIIYYDFDKSNIRRDASNVLDRVLALMKEHSEMNITLFSYTDSRGNDVYNMALSQRRAKSATAYLIRNGIAPSRIKAKGYGETHLVNKCKNGVKCSEAAHQLNRRTEIIIISM